MDIAEDPFYQSLPNRPWCSDYARGLEIGHRVSLEMRDRADAIRLPFVQINAPGIYRHMAVGVPDSFSWEDARLPQPSLTVLSHNRLDAQLIWTLKSAVTTSAKARSGPQDYAFRVVRAVEERLGGKAIVPRDRRGLAMNPYFSGFDTIRADATYSLDQLAEAALEGFRPRRRFAELCRISNRKREKALFDVVRLYAYRNVRRFQSEPALAESLINFAGVANLSFRRPLDARVVIKKAGDIAAWVWERRREIDGGRNRGASRLSRIPSSVNGEQRLLLIAEHQRAGANFSSRLKLQSSVRRILGAIMRPTLDDEPHSLRVSDISRDTGLHRNTIRPQLQTLKPLLKPIDILVFRVRSTVSDYPPKCASPSDPPAEALTVSDYPNCQANCAVPMKREYRLRIVWDE